MEQHRLRSGPADRENELPTTRLCFARRDAEKPVCYLTDMPVCFVIQPFDSGKFDKRFDDVYKPAIEAAGLEAYRVDRDPGVEVPIDGIEDGIRTATICLADITTDNPNVWYELGFAYDAGRPVVMVCSKERPDKRYPFDIQHRTIIPYGADSPLLSNGGLTHTCN